MDVLKHRGPDNATIWEQHNTMLGHTRLSIVDLSSAGNQPFHNATNSIHLVCNGEIYNAPELRKQLKAIGYRFTSHSDNEVILHGFEEWGPSVVKKLIGMFAFIIWDERGQRIFAARDHTGIKPLYYKAGSESFEAASELTALTGSISIEEMDSLSLAYYFFLGYVPSPRTINKDYQKLEPGTYLTWREGQGPRIHRYWSPPDKIHPEESINFEELFHNVLQDHLLSDVPIGTFLSSGLDSTSITAGLKELGYDTTAITIGFPGSDRNEAPLANKIAQRLGIMNEIVNIESSDTFELIDKATSIYDEPQGYSALLTMTQVCEVASKKCKVILSGDGGDEVMGGYNWYQNIGLQYSSGKRRTANRLLYKLTGHKKFLNEHYFKTTSDLHRHAWRLYPRFLPEEIETILKPFDVKFTDEIALAPLRQYFTDSLPLKRALQRVDLMTFCADSINPKVDRASMAYSMEVRVPFLDKRMIEYGMSRPYEDESPKEPLRNYLNKKVPPKVFENPKQGFSAQMFNKYIFEQIKQKNNNSELFKVFNLKNLRSDEQHWMIFNLDRFLDR